MVVHIETSNLILRDLEEYDVEGMYLLDSDPEVHEYLGKNPIQSRDEAKADIQMVRAQYRKNGIGRWAIEDKITGDFIGWTGLKFEQELRDFGYYDLGYRIRRKYWGRGIATETALASLEYGFTKLNLKLINAAADINHGASNRVLQKIGMKLVETFDFHGTPLNWYSLNQKEWNTMQ